jgi:signal transduction histidine kinase
MTRRSIIWAGAIVVLSSGFGLAQAEPKEIVFTHSLGAEFSESDIRTAPVAFAPWVFDARESRRRDTSAVSLPSGVVVRFDASTVLQHYGYHIALAALTVAVGGILIAAALVERRRFKRADAERRRAEQAVLDLGGRSIKATEEERSRLVRELHDNVMQRLEVNAGAVPDDTPRDVSLCLFRIAQEGLRNIERHAKAGGGDVEIESAPGEGTLILARVPLKEECLDSRACAAG